MRTQGIETLVSKSGEEKVTFKDVADHLADYLDRYPNEAAVVDNVAKFLAGVEDVEHDHDVQEVGSDA